MTARTRFVLWIALRQLAVALNLALQPAHDDKKPIRTIADDPGGPAPTVPYPGPDPAAGLVGPDPASPGHRPTHVIAELRYRRGVGAQRGRQNPAHGLSAAA